MAGVKNPQHAEFVPEIDIPILRELPDEGTQVGLRPMGAQVSYLLRKNPEWDLTAGQISGRLKSLRILGYATDVKLVGAKPRGWQITAAGKVAIGKEKA